MMLKITKPQAKKLFDIGRELIICPCKCAPNSMFAVKTDKGRVDLGETFEQFINAFAYYNCDSERGRYLHFYICE